MPGFNKTGPEGKGPKTGRGQGNCKNEPSVQEPENNEMGASTHQKSRKRLRFQWKGGGGMRNRFRNMRK